MALVRSQYWYPEILDSNSDISLLLREPAVILDYPFAVLVCAWSLGIQASVVVPIARALMNSIRNGTKRNRASTLLVATSTLALMFSTTGLMYCGAAILRLAILSRRAGVGVAALDGGDLGRSHGALQEQGRVLSQMVAVGMQLMVIMADMLLIYRCWIVFNGKKWVCVIPCVPFVISLALSLYGIVAVARAPPTPPGTPITKTAALRAAPFIATLSSVSVNVIVTSLICSQIIRSRRRLRKILGTSSGNTSLNSTGPSDTFFAIAILVEAALPSAIVGVYVPLATFATRGGVFASRLAWAAFTALAPQVILVRVLKRRDVMSVLQKHEKESSLEFSRSPTSMYDDHDRRD